MPLFFLILGVVLLDSGLHGSASATYQQVKIDTAGFLSFGAAIIILGGVGYFDGAKPIAKGLLTLLFVVFFLRNGNKLISNLTGAATQTNVSPQAAPATTPALPSDTTNQSAIATQTQSTPSSVLNDVLTVATLFA